MELVQECTYQSLDLDEACVSLTNHADVTDLWLYTLSSDCHQCPYTRGADLPVSRSLNAKVDTATSQSWRIVKTTHGEPYISASINNGTYCQISPEIGEYGRYELAVRPNATCDFTVLEKAGNPYTPLIMALVLVIILLWSLSAWKTLRRRRRDSARHRGTGGRDNKDETDGGGGKATDGTADKRVRSLDAVRGASILLMIFVNNGAGGYRHLEHATWDGLYVGDLVFPCFMWIMGVCIPLSASSALSRGTSKLALSWAILKRSFYLFFIGVSLNTLANTQLEDIRVFGVLQRFSVAYLVAATVHTLAFRPNTATKWKGSSLADVMVMLPEWVVAFLVLAAHCLIVLRLPVPDCPNGYFGPGGLHADGKYWNCTGGATGYLDRILLGERHVYRHPTASGVYASGAFDPEGVVGCLPSIFQVFLGMHAGQILKAHRAWKGRLLRWLSWAVVYGLVAGALHYTGAIPINKNLWSLSFVMITTCFNLGLLSVFYLAIDVTGAWQGGPFRIPGMNALVMYTGHQVLWSMFPFHWKIGRMNSHALLLTESIWCVGLWTLVAYVLHRKKIYVRL